MGITGLIPFLEKASKATNVNEFSGGTVAIDAYCWLHKGVFSCADKLLRGDDCNMYVSYCVKFLNMLLSKNIKPILVFDGQRLPAKLETEEKRRELRDQNRKKAAELMRLDKASEAQTYIRRCIDITHQMALNLIRYCRSRNIDCIVAPYEADAQLAFLNIQNIADVIITEDSDLLLFGAKKVLFKMDVNGNGLLIERSKLHLAMGVREEEFSFEKFRYMCILSGCDYLSSLPGIGLVKACRFIKTTRDPDIHRAISRVALHLNMPQLTVTKEYRDKFIDADFMFRHQPVYDPLKRKLVPLTPIEEDNESVNKFNELISIKNLSDNQIDNLAFGNLDPSNLKQMDDWDPSNRIVPRQTTAGKLARNFSSVTTHPSIWQENYVPRKTIRVIQQPPNALCPVSSNTVRKSPENLKKKFFNSRRSLPIITTDGGKEEFGQDEFEQLENEYRNNEHENREETSMESKTDNPGPNKAYVNPFSAKASIRKSGTDNQGALSKFVRLYKNSFNTPSSNEIVNSRYFSSSNVESARNTGTEIRSTDSRSTSLSPEIITSPERSPLKVLNKSLIDEYCSPQIKSSKVLPKSIFADDKLEDEFEKRSSESRKRTNPFAVGQQDKKSCSPGFINKLSVFRNTSYQNFEKQDTSEEETMNSFIDASNKFRYPRLDMELSCQADELNTTIIEENVQSQQSEDEGFYSMEANSSQSSSTTSPLKTQAPVETLTTTCRYPGLKRKPVPKQLSLREFMFKPAQKLKM